MTHFKQEKSSLPIGAPIDSDQASVEVKTFQPRNLSGGAIHSREKPKEHFGTGANGRFNLHPAARKSLGIESEEDSRLENRIAEEVDRRLALMSEQARAKGFALGKMEGEKLAIQEFQNQTQPIFAGFLRVMNDFDSAKSEIYHANEAFLIQLVFQVARQVTLKEIKTDPEYVKNLCGLLVEKIGAKDHVKIKVGQADFAQVEAIRDYLKQQFVDLKNIQIDVSDEFINGGCKVETDLARINASVDTQLQLINQSLGEQ